MAVPKRVATWTQQLLASWGQWLHVAYGLVVVISLFYAGASEAKDVRVLIAYIAVFVYVLVLLLFLGYFIVSYSRKARYSEAMYCIHSAIHQIRDAHSYLEHCRKAPVEYEGAKFEQMLRAVLDSVAQAFDIVSAVGNRACIKVLAGSSGREFARTLCRDSASHERHKDDDKQEKEKHLIDLNTDFHLLAKGEGRYFLSNDLRRYPFYMNTSLGPDVHKAITWSLPYVSSLVFPIRLTKDASGSGVKGIKVLGFLAVDSAARGAYTERYDVEMGAIVADGLFPLLELWVHVDAESNKVRSEHRQSR